MEPRHGGDAVACEGENEYSGWTRHGLIAISEVARKTGLIVGPAGKENDAAFAPKGEACCQERPDRLQAVVLVRCRRHRQPGVVGEQAQDAVDVSSDVRVSEAAGEITLLGRCAAGGPTCRANSPEPHDLAAMFP